MLQHGTIEYVYKGTDVLVYEHEGDPCIQPEISLDQFLDFPRDFSLTNIHASVL